MKTESTDISMDWPEEKQPAHPNDPPSPDQIRRLGEMYQGDIIPDAVQPLPAASTDIREQVETAILAIEPETPIDQVCDAISKLDAIARWCKDQDKILKDRLDPYIRRNGEINLGTDRFYIGESNEMKCEDHRQAMAEIIVAAAKVDPETGEEITDWPRVFDCLSKNAIKQSEAREILPPEAFARLFKRYPKSWVARSGGKAEQVQRVDTRFIEG